MALLEILSDQSAFGFTGKINVLVKSSGQFYGVIYQNEGYFVDALLDKMRGKKALYSLIFSDVETDNYLKYVVEPEILKEENFSFKVTYDELKTEAQKNFQLYLNAKKLKPPTNLKLIINPKIVVNADEISPEEFEVLTLLTEWSQVADLYKQSKLLEFEITNALVSLRKKKAIRVFQNS